MIVKHPGYGLGIYGALHALSTAARFSSTIDNRLSVVVFHGMKYDLKLNFVQLTYLLLSFQIKSTL